MILSLSGETHRPGDDPDEPARIGKGKTGSRSRKTAGRRYV